MSVCRRCAWFVLTVTLSLTMTPYATRAAIPSPMPGPYAPDPASVQRYGPAYRYPQSGWTVLHIEGSPYERGYQHGRLMSTEIADIVKSLATYRSPKAPSEGWRDERTIVDALFLRKYAPEYLE